jgi:predicted transposase/invertase (TIGR01784 family)
MELGIDPKADSAFKRLFGIEENAPLLVHLLNAVLSAPRPVTGVEFLPLQSEPAGAADKQVIGDVRVRDQGRRQFQVEMQRRWSWWYFKRLLLDWAVFHPLQVRRGEDYETLRPTVPICFLDDTIRDQRFAGVKAHRLVFRPRELTQGIELCDDLTVYVIVLPLFTRGPDELETDLDRWCYFLRHAARLDPEKPPAALDVPPIRKAFEVLRMFSSNPDLRALYDAEERARLIRQSEISGARLEGLNEGELIGRVRMCQQLLGLPETPLSELAARSQAELSALLAQLSGQFKHNGA